MFELTIVLKINLFKVSMHVTSLFCCNIRLQATQPIPAGRAGGGDFLPAMLQNQKPLQPQFGSQSGFVLPYMAGVSAAATQPAIPPIQSKAVSQDSVTSLSTVSTTSNQVGSSHVIAPQVAAASSKTNEIKPTNTLSGIMYFI